MMSIDDDTLDEEDDEIDCGGGGGGRFLAEGDPLLTEDGEDSPHHYQMHRPKLEDRFGTVRFRVEYSPKRELLLVTVIDAWDLPPMDGDGKADPYLEVSLRPPGPGRKKYTTSIKSNCLNPTFNETAELPVKWNEIEGESVSVDRKEMICPVN